MARDAQVDKVVRVVATSGISWEDAARVGVAEGARTITDLQVARVIESDLVITDGAIVRYRVTLEMTFQLDRSRVVDGSQDTITVRRYLVIANRTLPSAALHELVRERLANGPSEFHVLVPEPPSPITVGDATTGMIPLSPDDFGHQLLLGIQEAEDRLDVFMRAFRDLGAALSGEVGVGDPISSVRRVMERSSFDEIIVSTLPHGVSRWLKLDLPNRLQHHFPIPVISLVQSP